MESVIEVKNLFKSYGLGDGKVDILKDRENYRKKKTDNIKLPDIDWLNEDE